MIRVRYIGQREDLKGETALALKKGKNRILIQSDNLSSPLAFGWHEFAAGQWEAIEEEKA
jgi:hypothetical protein